MKCRRGLFQKVSMLMAMVFFSACGGGGGTSNNTPAKTSITGVVSFPVATERMGTAKRTAAIASESSVTVEAYTLDGVLVPAASVHPTYDDTAATRIYSYAIPNLAANVDYIIKAKRGSVVLKKLIASKDMVAGSVADQTVNAVSTAAVVVASQKLSTATVNVVLGDTLPTGKTVAGLSADIGTSVKPALLEQSITAAISGSMANITTVDSANFANVFNIVVTAVVEDKDPALVFAGTSTLTGGVPIFQVTGAVVTPPSTDATTWSVPTATAIADISSATVATYTAPTESAKTYTDLADKYLAAQDISNAGLNYEKALSIDANDKKANLGGAITSGLMLMEDPDVKSIVAKWGGVLPTVNQMVQGTSPVKLPFLNMTSGGSAVSAVLPKSTAKSVAATNSLQNALATFKTLQAQLPQQKIGFKSMAKELALVPTTAPTVAEMQALIDNVIIPRIDKVLSRLAKVEGSGFSFTITKAMKGNPLYGTDTILADGEFYTLDAALNLFQVPFKIATAYNFDIPAPYDYNNIGQDPLAFINNASFFTLKADGGTKMNAALAYAKVAAAKAATAFDILKIRAAGTGAFDLSTWSAADKDSFSKSLSNVTELLAGQTTMDFGFATLTVNATKFFTNPLTRATLPTFGYDVPRDATLSAKYGRPVAAERMVSYQYWDGTAYVNGTPNVEPVECNLVPKSDLPDYTLNGILPNNTAASNIADFTGILPALNGQIVSLAAGGDIAPYLAWDRQYDAQKFYFYRKASFDAKVLDTTTGVMSTYFTSVSGIPSGMSYQGLRYWSAPSGIYALLSSATTSAAGTTLTFGYYPITVANNVCQIGATAVKTLSVPPGRSNFMTDTTGNIYLANTVGSPTNTYTLYSSVDPSVALLTLDTNQKTLLNIRNGIVSVYDRSSNNIFQYQINAAGTAVSQVGWFVNVDYNSYVSPTSDFNKILAAGGGYYWVFDGNKLIQYAGKPDGAHL